MKLNSEWAEDSPEITATPTAPASPPEEPVPEVIMPTVALKFARAGSLAEVTANLDFIRGLLTVNGSSLLYGSSNLGKTFLVYDMAAAVATGRPFRDELEVDPGAVLYFSLEGRTGAMNRLAAMKQRGLIDDDTPLFFSFDGINLALAREKDSLSYGDLIAETVRAIEAQESIPLRLVVIDTLSRAMGGGEENSGRDMMLVVGEIDLIRAETSAHVMVVHHCGKDDSRGARGSSSLRAAVDTEIELSRPEGSNITTARVTKQRDMEIGPPMPFSLEVIELGTDHRGTPITSCIVHHEDEMMAPAKSKSKGRPPTASPADLLKLLPQVRTKDWQQAAKDELGVSESAFFLLLKMIRAENSAVNSKGTGWHLPKVIFGS